MPDTRPSIHEVILLKIERATKSVLHLPEFEKELSLLCDILLESRIPKQATKPILIKLGEMESAFEKRLSAGTPLKYIKKLILDIEGRK
ncbi:MAG: hypothetical protein ACKKL6_01705 [Candidatus Komeilibacteria bacterium]